MLDRSIVDAFIWIVGIVDALCTGILVSWMVCVQRPWIVVSWTIVYLKYQLVDVRESSEKGK